MASVDEKVDSILALAEERFGEPSAPLRLLVRHTLAGEPVDFSGREAKDPANAENWTGNRVIEARQLAWFLTAPETAACITGRGVEITGARIDGVFDLAFQQCPFPLGFFHCAFTGPVVLMHAKVRGLYFNGSRTREIVADGLTVQGDLGLRDGFHAHGEVRLLGAKIGGDLECQGGHFENRASEDNENTHALSADRISVEGSVILGEDFHAHGEVRLLNAKIAGNLECPGGHFENPASEHNKNAHALNADGVSVGGGVFLNKDFRAQGDVRLRGAMIAGNLECQGGHFENPASEHKKNARALSADRVSVGGSVFLNEGFHAQGEVRLLGAKIGGQLACKGGHFENPASEHNQNADALSADRISVGGDVFLNEGFQAHGEVRLLGAKIEGNLQCRGGHFENPASEHNQNADALSADRISVGGNVYLDESFHAQGAVRLLGAKIGGDLSCGGGRFENPASEHNKNADALSLETAHIEGALICRQGFRAEGRVDLIHSRIDSLLIWRDVEVSSDLILDLRRAHAGTLWDDADSWPKQGNLRLNGFTYDYLDDEAPRDSRSRKCWLARQPCGRGGVCPAALRAVGEGLAGGRTRDGCAKNPD